MHTCVHTRTCMCGTPSTRRVEPVDAMEQLRADLWQDAAACRARLSLRPPHLFGHAALFETPALEEVGRRGRSAPCTLAFCPCSHRMAMMPFFPAVCTMQWCAPQEERRLSAVCSSYAFRCLCTCRDIGAAAVQGSVKEYSFAWPGALYHLATGPSLSQRKPCARGCPCSALCGRSFRLDRVRTTPVAFARVRMERCICVSCVVEARERNLRWLLGCGTSCKTPAVPRVKPL